ncbi:hypothetical protein ACW14Y_04920 [Kitasatospora sp. cg17-2]
MDSFVNLSGGDDENSDEGGSDTTAEMQGFVRDVAQRDDVPQDLKERAQALAGK